MVTYRKRWRPGGFPTEIHESIARTLYVYAWANVEEEAGRTYPGMELFDVAPETTELAKEVAWDAIEEMEKLNGMFLTQMYEQALLRADLDEDAGLEEEFGHAIAMEMLGTGVTWRDDYPHHGLEIPDVEWLDVLEPGEWPPPEEEE